MSNRISTTLNDVKYQLQDPIKSAGDRGIGFVGFNAPVLSRVISSFGEISSLKIAPKKSYAFGSSLKRGKTGVDDFHCHRQGYGCRWIGLDRINSTTSLYFCLLLDLPLSFIFFFYLPQTL